MCTSTQPFVPDQRQFVVRRPPFSSSAHGRRARRPEGRYVIQPGAGPPSPDGPCGPSGPPCPGGCERRGRGDSVPPMSRDGTGAGAPEVRDGTGCGIARPGWSGPPRPAGPSEAAGVLTCPARKLW